MPATGYDMMEADTLAQENSSAAGNIPHLPPSSLPTYPLPPSSLASHPLVKQLQAGRSSCEQPSTPAAFLHPPGACSSSSSEFTTIDAHLPSVAGGPAAAADLLAEDRDDAASSLTTQPDEALLPVHEGPPDPANEEERTKTVECLQIIDSPEDPVLNSLCTLLCSILKVPMAGAAAFLQKLCQAASCLLLPACSHSC